MVLLWAKTWGCYRHLSAPVWTVWQNFLCLYSLRVWYRLHHMVVLDTLHAVWSTTALFSYNMYCISRSQWPRGLCCCCGFESRRGHRCLSFVSVLCCQVEATASGWSLVQRGPTDFGVSDSVCVCIACSFIASFHSIIVAIHFLNLFFPNIVTEIRAVITVVKKYVNYNYAKSL